MTLPSKSFTTGLQCPNPVGPVQDRMKGDCVPPPPASWQETVASRFPQTRPSLPAFHSPQDVKKPGNIGYVTQPKFWSLCEKANCSSLSDQVWTVHALSLDLSPSLYPMPCSIPTPYLGLQCAAFLPKKKPRFVCSPAVCSSPLKWFSSWCTLALPLNGNF